MPAEIQAKYTSVIDGILAISDLEQITAKTIRAGIQGAVDHDVTPYKVRSIFSYSSCCASNQRQAAIKLLIGQRFDKIHADSAKTRNSVPVSTANQINGIKPVANGVKPKTNGTTRHSSPKPSSSIAKRSFPSDDNSDSNVVDVPSPKKKKKRSLVNDPDAELAARLQAEENGRARPMRGGSTRRQRPPVKKSPKKKSKAKVDDSDAESGAEEGKEVKRNGAFHKPLTLSTPLSELLGESILSRPQTVKKIWEYVKERDLQDPSDKRQ